MTVATPVARCFDDTAEPVSQTPGRLRIRYPRLFRSEQVKNKIESALSVHTDIVEVCANPLTGKVLIHFDPAVSCDAMLAALGVARRKEPSAPPPQRAARAARAASTGSIASRQETSWHLMTAHQTLAQLGSDAHAGLTETTVEQRLRQGLNVLPQKEETPAYVLFFSQLKGLPVLLLGVSAALSLLTGGVAEAAAIVAVLGMNAGIGFVTERRAEKTIASLSDLVDETVPVIRDGRVAEIVSSHIVPGDLLMLTPGVHLTADARLVQSRGLLADESALTGESRFVAKSIAPLTRAAPLAERSNMVYMGTAVAAGTGLAVVTATGADTELGWVQTLVANAQPPQTPIQKQLDDLGNRLVMISLAICAAVFFIGLLRGRGLLEMLKAAISLAIAAVPEGLPTVATTSFARGLRVMRAKQMLIRRLQTIETLGAVRIICFDKTGTLTLNRMSVVALRTATHDYADDNGGSLSIPGAQHPADIATMLKICVLSNESGIAAADPAASLSSGSATENALVRLANDSGVSGCSARERFPLLQAELRAEGRNYMTTLHAERDTNARLLTVKGNPLEVLQLCSFLQAGADIAPLTQQPRARIMEQNSAMAARQLRVLGFAYAQKAQGDAPQFVPQQLIWLGLIGLADPIRPNAEQTIAEFHRAGIRTVMITGDQRATARAIGERLGLAGDRELHVLDADYLDEVDPATLDRTVSEADVFARVSPGRKLQIVQALQKQGEVVAMVGDGVNDGPALRAADIGIAMGQQGTNLARSAADVVLQDDRLETVLDAVRQGRTITQNIGKSLEFLISSNLSEILVVLGAVSLTGASPLTPMQLLWVNLLSDVLPAVALAAEPPEGDVMRHPPRDPAQPLVGKRELMRYGREGAWLTGGALGAYLYGIARYGMGAQSGGIAFNTLMLGQLLHALTCRSRGRDLASHRMLDVAVGGSIGLQALANLLPPLRRLLGLSGPAGLADLAVILAGAGIPLLCNEAARKANSGVPETLEGNWRRR